MRETARMSFPGRMSGVVCGGIKKRVEEYFIDCFPVEDVSTNAIRIAKKFDQWHEKRVRELADHIKRFIRKNKNCSSHAIAAKFLNLFLYQLQKHEPFRPLWKRLHLPLDRQILMQLEGLKIEPGSIALAKLEKNLHKRAYKLRYAEYKQIQDILFEYLDELNKKSRSEPSLSSRVQLNLLWAK